MAIHDPRKDATPATIEPYPVPDFFAAKSFEAAWASAGLGPDDLTRLYVEIAADPEAAPVIAGTGGLRKLRFALPGGGKSGGVRVCYAAYLPRAVLLFAVYAKGQQATLSATEKMAAAKFLAAFERATAARE